MIDALAAGLDRVARRPWLMGVPIGLDVFLWIGPRLQATPLYDTLVPNLRSLAQQFEPGSQVALAELSAALKAVFTQFNLFSWLSVTGVGVPAVNAGVNAALPLPIGALPPTAQVGDFGAYLTIWLLLTAVGLVLGGFFWAGLAAMVRGETFQLRGWLRSGAWVGMQLLGLGAAGMLIGLALLLPVSVLVFTLSAISLGLASLIPAVLLTVLLWSVLYLMFTAHGLALYHWPVGRAVRMSTWIVRDFFVPTLGLAALSVAIYLGLNIIWNEFAVDSWLRVMAIVGHAYVATSLALASVVYFQNRAAILAERRHWPVPSGL